MSSRRGKRRSKIGGPFAARTIAMLESPAYRALTLAAHRVLSRLEIELARHAGNDNGNLIVPFDDFEEYGIHRDAIAPAIRQLVDLGFLEITERGRGGNAACTRTPTKYRLTTRPAGDADATNEWKKIGRNLKETRAARRAKTKTQSRKAGPAPVPESGTEAANFPVPESVPQASFPSPGIRDYYLESPGSTHGGGVPASSPAPPASPGRVLGEAPLPSQATKSDLESIFAARRARNANGGSHVFTKEAANGST